MIVSMNLVMIIVKNHRVQKNTNNAMDTDNIITLMQFIIIINCCLGWSFKIWTRQEVYPIANKGGIKAVTIPL